MPPHSGASSGWRQRRRQRARLVLVAWIGIHHPTGAMRMILGMNRFTDRGPQPATC